MSKPPEYFQVDGIPITPKAVTKLREYMIDIRNQVMDADGSEQLVHAFNLSLVIAILGDYKDIIINTEKEL